MILAIFDMQVCNFRMEAVSTIKTGFFLAKTSFGIKNTKLNQTLMVSANLVKTITENKENKSKHDSQINWDGKHMVKDPMKSQIWK